MTTQTPKWHFFMHGTTQRNTLSILKTGKINPSKPEMYFDKKSNLSHYDYFKSVFCHYIFDKLPNPHRIFEWRYTKEYIIVIDPTISKDMPMVVCNEVAYGCKPTDEDCIMYTKGNLTRLPALHKLRSYILEQIQNIVDNGFGRKNLAEIKKSYIMNHEVLFPEVDIKYIRAILIPLKYKKIENTKNIQKYIEENNLPIKIIFYPTTTNIDFHTLFEQI